MMHCHMLTIQWSTLDSDRSLFHPMGAMGLVLSAVSSLYIYIYIFVHNTDSSSCQVECAYRLWEHGVYNPDSGHNNAEIAADLKFSADRWEGKTSQYVKLAECLSGSCWDLIMEELECQLYQCARPNDDDEVHDDPFIESGPNVYSINGSDAEV